VLNVMADFLLPDVCRPEKNAQGPKPMVARKSVSSVRRPTKISRWSDSNNNNTPNSPLSAAGTHSRLRMYVCRLGNGYNTRKGNSIFYLPHDGSRLSPYQNRTSMKRKAMSVAHTPQRCMNGRLGMITDIFEDSSSQPPPQEWRGVAEAPWQDIFTLDS
jgi:hypothetical protein